MSKSRLAPRWQNSGIQTLVRVVRVRQGLTGIELSQDVTGPPVRLLCE